MPLSPPVSRSLRHTRAITVEAFARDDGLWDLDASIRDVKTRDIELGSGTRPGGLPVHDLKLRVTTNYRWQDQTYTVVADPGSITPGYGLLGLTVGVGADDDSWILSVFARNLLDDYFVSGIFKTSLDGSASPAGCDTNPALCTTTLGYSNIPSGEARRTVGVKLDVKI